MINTAVIGEPYSIAFYFPHAETKDSMIKSKRHNDQKRKKKKKHPECTSEKRNSSESVQISLWYHLGVVTIQGQI